MLFNYLPKPSSYLSAALIVLSAAGFVMFIQGCVQAVEPRGLGHVPMQKLAMVGSEASATGEKASVTSPAQRDLSARQATLEAREVQLNRQYRQAQQICHTRFFVNPCLKKAHAHYRQEKAALRADQLMLEEAKRVKRVRERHQKAMSQQPALSKKLSRQHAAQKPDASQKSRDKAQSAHQLQHTQEAAQRAENIRHFEAKQRAAERHRLLMERRREARKRANTVSATNAMPDTTPSPLDLAQ